MIFASTIYVVYWCSKLVVRLLRCLLSGIKLLVSPFRIHQKQTKPCMKSISEICQCKLYIKGTSLLGHASEFNQKNLSEYKSHLIIKYFQFSSMNIRYLNERDNLHMHYITNNKRIFMWYVSYAVRTNEITLRHYCSVKLHVRFISRNVDTLVSTIKINKTQNT